MNLTARQTAPAIALVLALLVPGAVLWADASRIAEDSDRVRMAQYDPEATWAQADILVMGARVFDNRCSPCHGEAGHGDGDLSDVLAIRPRNYHVDPFKWGNSPAQIATTVAGGRSGIMPPFKRALSETEIWAVAYVVWRWIPEGQRSYDDRDQVKRWVLP